jgi:hypothetical protein
MTDQERDELIERVSQALDVPDPSPLFWEHFPDRVRAAVHAAPEASPFGWWRRRAGALALSMAAVAALATVLYVRDGSTPVDAPQPAVVQEIQPPADFESMDADAGWAVVSDVAESAGPEMLREAGFGVAPGATEPAIEALNEKERIEFMALLKAEMKGDD